MEPNHNWWVSQMVPYLDHIGIGAYRIEGGEARVQLLSNDLAVEVLSEGCLTVRGDGGYELKDFSGAVKGVPRKNEEYKWKGSDKQ